MAVQYEISQHIPWHYDTSFKHRGLAIIAIFHTFEPKRKITSIQYNEDLIMLTETFERQQYKVEVWKDAEDMTRTRFLNKVQEVADDEYHKNSESFAMVIITHGKVQGGLLAYDTEFQVDDVYNKFTADKCRKLAGKPKFFVFHACRGLDKSKQGHASGTIKGSLKGVSIPAEADMLVLFSTFEGKIAFGAGGEGSAFISKLKEVFLNDLERKDEEKKHILELTTEIISKMASFIWKIKVTGEVAKQQPVLMSTLLSLYYLKKRD